MQKRNWVERGCTKIEWQVLDWNEASINFYKSIGGKPKDGWIIYRLINDDLKNFVK